MTKALLGHCCKRQRVCTAAAPGNSIDAGKLAEEACHGQRGGGLLLSTRHLFQVFKYEFGLIVQVVGWLSAKEQQLCCTLLSSSISYTKISLQAEPSEDAASVADPT